MYTHEPRHSSTPRGTRTARGRGVCCVPRRPQASGGSSAGRGRGAGARVARRRGRRPALELRTKSQWSRFNGRDHKQLCCCTSARAMTRPLDLLHGPPMPQLGATPVIMPPPPAVAASADLSPWRPMHLPRVKLVGYGQRGDVPRMLPGETGVGNGIWRLASYRHGRGE